MILFYALQTHIQCIRVANADEWRNTVYIILSDVNGLRLQKKFVVE